MHSLRSFFWPVAAGLATVSLFAQNTPPPKPDTQSESTAKLSDRSAAYYNYAMGHLYADLAQTYGNRGDHVNKAIEFYKLAMKEDPAASFLAEELSDLYVQAGRLRDAVQESEEALKKNPDDLTSRRILARIYSRLVGDPQTRGLNEEMLKRAIEQYQKITAKDAKDLDSWIMLGRLFKMSQNSVEAKKAYEKALEIEPENSDALGGLALVLADVGDSAKAAELLGRVAQKNPNLRTLTALAAAYEQMRDFNMAAETLRKALELQPDNVEIKRDYANTLIMAERYDDAQRVYEELIKEEPRDTLSHLRLSQIYRQKGQFNRAWSASNQAKKLDPNNLEIRYNEVSLNEAEGKYAEAIAALRDVLKQTQSPGTAAEKGNRAMLLERLGVLHRNNDQPAEAVEAFRQMGELDKELAPRAAAQVIDTWRQSRDYTKAIAAGDEALKLFPEDRMIRLVRASSLSEAGRGKEAITDLKAMLDGKQDREIHLQLAQLYDKQKSFAEMSASLDAAEKLSKSDEEKLAVWFSRGAMLERQKKFDEAEREFRKVLAVDASNAGALNYLGYMLADRNVRVGDAEKMIVKALEQDPNNGAYLDSLGWAQYRLGKYSDAEDTLRRAAQRVPKDPTVHDHLGDVYFKQEKLKEAIASWQVSIKEWESSSPIDQEAVDIAKVQKKLEGAKTRLAREGSVKPRP